MSSVFEKLEKIDEDTQEKIRVIEAEEERRRLEEKEKTLREEAEKNKTEEKKKILEIIENPDPELDEPKLWTVKYGLGNPISLNIKSCSKTIVMTERQKMLLEQTSRLGSLAYGYYESFESISEVEGKELTDLEKTRLEGLRKKIELLKNSTDPALDEKGIYESIVAYNGEKYEHWLHKEKVETEMTLRQALLVITPETREYFRTYTQIKEDEEKKLEEKKSKEKEELKENTKSSRITFKSIKKAIKSKLKLR